MSRRRLGLELQSQDLLTPLETPSPGAGIHLTLASLEEYGLHPEDVRYVLDFLKTNQQADA